MLTRMSCEEIHRYHQTQRLQKGRQISPTITIKRKNLKFKNEGEARTFAGQHIKVMVNGGASNHEIYTQLRDIKNLSHEVITNLVNRCRRNSGIQDVASIYQQPSVAIPGATFPHISLTDHGM